MARFIANNNKQIYIFKNDHEMADFTLQKWLEIYNRAIKNKGYFTAAVSGGKTPVEFYQKFGKQNLAWDKIHIFLVDERCVPFSHQDSNYKLIKENLINSKYICYISVEKIPAKTAAEKYAQILNKFFKIKNNALPKFDLIMLGIGEDGHTASLFPNDQVALETQQSVVAVKNKNIKHERVTITLPVINNARNIIFLVSGEKKAHAVKEIIQHHNISLPAANVNPNDGELFFFVNEEAWGIN